MSGRAKLAGTLLAALTLVATAACGGADDSASQADAGANAELLAVASTVDMSEQDYSEYINKLTEASKAEGGVLSYYFSAPAASAQPQFDAFEAVYPWVDVQYVSGGTLELIERVSTEAAAGRESADVLQGGPLEDNTLCKDQGLCLQYDPLGEKGLPADRAYADCSCTVSDFFTFHMLYNNKKVSAEEAPQSLEDLTDPKWRGRFGINVDQLDWFAGTLAWMGEERGLALMRRLADNSPVAFSGSEGLEMLAAGAFDAAVPFSVTRQTITAIEDGAPLTVITPDTVIAQPDMYFPMAKAPHPATTRLYMEFLMSPAFQQNLHEIVKKVPITPGAPIAPLAQDILKKELFFETTENFGNYDTRVEQHQALFITG